MHRPNSPWLDYCGCTQPPPPGPFVRTRSTTAFGLLFRYCPQPPRRDARHARAIDALGRARCVRAADRARARIASHRIASPASQSLSRAAQLVAPFVALRSAACCTMCCTLHAVAFVRHVAKCRLSSRHTRHSLPLVNPVVRSAPCGELRAHASALSDGFPFHHWAASCRRQMTLGRDARPPVLQRNSPL